MTLLDAIRNLATYEDDACIYGKEPWTRDSESVVGSHHRAVVARGFMPLVEVSVVRPGLGSVQAMTGREWTAEEMCDSVIEYAIKHG